MLQNQARPPLPTRAALRPDGLYLALRDIGPAQLRDAFMQETVVRVPATETYVHIERADLGKTAPGTAPAGLIFHVARCGSTLISQLLKQHDQLVVYSEPLPFNEILLPPHALPRHEIVAALRSLGDAFSRHAGKPYVLKLSSWNTLFCDLVTEAFPESPWILSLREPVEVGVSLLQQPAGWMQGAAGGGAKSPGPGAELPGPGLRGPGAELRGRSAESRGRSAESRGPGAELRRHVDPEAASRSPEEFVAQLYGAFCNAAAGLDATRGKLVRYEALPAAAWEAIAPHFSLHVDDGLRERMRQAARINAKAPVGKAAEFGGDAATKQASATPALRQAIDALARPALERLEALHGALHIPAKKPQP